MYLQHLQINLNKKGDTRDTHVDCGPIRTSSIKVGAIQNSARTELIMINHISNV